MRLALALLLALLPGLAAAASWVVTTDRAVYARGEPVVVRYAGFTDPKDWMVVVPAGTPDSVWEGHPWIYRENRPADGTVTFQPLPPGRYEVRGYCCWDGRDFTVQSRAAFEVTARRAGAPEDGPVPARATVRGKYSGLIASFACEQDRATYGDFHDYGRWAGGPWCGRDRPAGFWVWVAPKWYIWRSQN